MTDRYMDIIYLPRHISYRHPHMSMLDRAAQFSPFAALTGYDAAVKEEGRLTCDRIDLDKYDAELLDKKFQLLQEKIRYRPEVMITYFVADALKEGGDYEKLTSIVRRVDSIQRTLILVDDQIIPIDDVISLEGEIFRDME